MEWKNLNHFFFFPELKSKLSPVGFSIIYLSHICRLGDFIVHNLAKYARNVSSYFVWMESAHSHLTDVLLVDFG